MTQPRHHRHEQVRALLVEGAGEPPGRISAAASGTLAPTPLVTAGGYRRT